jgi:hypothetical protein
MLSDIWSEPSHVGYYKVLRRCAFALKNLGVGVLAEFPPDETISEFKHVAAEPKMLLNRVAVVHTVSFNGDFEK